MIDNFRNETAYDGLADPEALSTLFPLPGGKWRSLGRHLDYSNWPDRDRFMQLDRAIEAERLRELN